MICSIKYFFKEILYPCPFLIATSFGSYHRFLDSWMLLISKLLKKGSLWLRWSHHCIYLTNDHNNVPYVVPKHLNSPVYFRVVMSAIISMKVRFGSCFIYCIYIYFRILVSNAIWCGAGSAKLSRAPLLLSGVHVEWLLVFCIMFYGSLFVLLWFFTLPLCCPSFDLRLLITPMVSSNYSHLNMWCSPSKKIDNVST